MPLIADVEASLRRAPRRFLVTGAAGFIGSHLCEALVRLDQHVVGLDNLSTGRRSNVKAVSAVPTRGTFSFVEGDVCDLAVMERLCGETDVVLHQAALGSVPRSIENPVATHRANVDGFVTVLEGARRTRVRRVVYASSSSVYGDDPGLPKVESRTGRVLSPYAASKAHNELWAAVCQRTYGTELIGLRYFNVFGPRQDPNGPYAAVIPRWALALSQGQACEIFGTGETTRDFCFVANVVQANLLAACCDASATNAVYNVAVGTRTSLNTVYDMLREAVGARVPAARALRPQYRPPRQGDIQDSQADISQAQTRLGYRPSHTVAQGLALSVGSFLEEAA